MSAMFKKKIEDEWYMIIIVEIYNYENALQLEQ